MYNTLVTIMLVISVLLIIVVALQPTKTSNSSTAFMGGAKDIFAQTKARGFEAFLQRATIVLGAAFMIIAVIIAATS